MSVMGVPETWSVKKRPLFLTAKPSRYKRWRPPAACKLLHWAASLTTATANTSPSTFSGLASICVYLTSSNLFSIFTLVDCLEPITIYPPPPETHLPPIFSPYLRYHQQQCATTSTRSSSASTTTTCTGATISVLLAANAKHPATTLGRSSSVGPTLDRFLKREFLPDKSSSPTSPRLQTYNSLITHTLGPSKPYRLRAHRQLEHVQNPGNKNKQKTKISSDWASWAPEQQSNATEYGYRRTSLFTVIDWMEMETKKRGAHAHERTRKPPKQNTKKKKKMLP